MTGKSAALQASLLVLSLLTGKSSSSSYSTTDRLFFRQHLVGKSFPDRMKSSTGLALLVAFVIFQMATAQETTTSCSLTRCPPKCVLDRCTCACPETCQNANCTEDEECVLEKIVCIRAPCFPKPTCVPRKETTTEAIEELLLETTASAIPDIATTPCMIEVDCIPDCERVIGSDGCPTCSCPPTCQDVNCTKDEECVLEEVTCIKAPCFPVPTCVPKNVTTTACPMIMCAEGCVLDEAPNRCPWCACPQTCENANCTQDEECVLKEVWCITAPCFPIPTCVPKNETTTPAIPDSSTTGCAAVIYCDFGCYRLFDLNACPYCACPPTCENVTCARDEVCVLKQIRLCVTVPCFPVPRCVPKNETTTPSIPDSSTTGCGPEILCLNGCQRLLDSDGCPYCDCPPTCEGTECRDGYICEMQEQSCHRPPCPIRPVCIPMDSCSGTPNTTDCGRNTIRWFYNSTSDACQKFRYYGCTPSANTFLSRKACREKCIPHSCPTQCNIRCMYGLKTDKDGCSLCECLEKPE